MPIPKSRVELLDAIEMNYGHLDKDLRTVPATKHGACDEKQGNDP